MGKPQLLRYEEWCSVSGDRWYCNDTSCMSSIRSLWWVPARMLKISLTDYVELLVKEFKVDNISFDGKTLIYSWNSLNKCRLFKNWINKKAREGKWII